MKTLHVGGASFFNRFGNLEAAVERAEHDDIIELHKDVHGLSVVVGKNITINGNGHTVTPADGRSAINATSFVTLCDIRFECSPRTNAVIIQNGGNLKKITTCIMGPVRALYPTVVQKGGKLVIEESEIMFLETHEEPDRQPTVTFFKKSVLKDYYGGHAYLNNGDASLSKFNGMSCITDSVITCALLRGECTMSGTVLENFNRATGTVSMASCELRASRGKIQKHRKEPSDGPLKDLKPNVVPFALHIAGGRVTAEEHSSSTPNDCIGFYMTGGSLEIYSTEAHNSQARHLLKGGSVVFDSVVDDAFYEIGDARCSVIRSQVNTSMQVKTAMEELNEMIGLDAVKKQIRTIVNTINVTMNCPEKDFGFSHHMVFAGDPGTGKTTVAKLVARALFEIGAIPEDKCMEVPASQLIKGYVGQTGEHVESVIRDALGGVLFIDEAYELMVKDGQNTFNNDALAVLLRYMEDCRDNLVVIAAGYEDEMRQFLASNVGLTRRFQWVSFEDYTPEEMTKIFLSMGAKCKEDYDFPEASAMLTDCFGRLTAYYLSHPDTKGRATNGGNGGLVRNLFQQVVFARNNRVAEHPGSTMQITREDIQTGFDEEWAKAANVSGQ